MLHARAALRPAARSCSSLSTAARAYATKSAQSTKPKAQSPIKPSVTTPDAKVAPPPPATTGSSRKNQTIQLRTYKPRTPGLRHLRRPINDHLFKGRPVKNLTIPKIGQGKGGRNNSGRVTVRHRGGGHKRRIRTVDFHRKIPGRQVVERIEYDPNRSAHIALLKHMKTGKLSYIIAAEDMREGDTVESFLKGIPKDLLESMGGSVDPGILAVKTAVRGNCLPLHMIPLGTQVFSVGSTANRKAVFCRSAGTYATVMSKEESEENKMTAVVIKMQSGETRKVDPKACATIGVASNPLHQYRQLGKAGRSRWMGRRPSVRGVAMNAADHPHGGGRGKSKGNVHPVSPWGVLAKGGYKTRPKRKKHVWLVKDRPRNQGKRRSKNR